MYSRKRGEDMPPVYRRSEKNLFVNPYTFIPTQRDTRISRADVESGDPQKLHTGVLRCRLFVRTPIGIPDAELGKEKNVKDHKEYPFFSYMEDGERILVIPGSSLRGAIRSVFEAATDSCFSTLRDDTGLSRRVGSREAYKPGILKWEKGGWHLYKADRYLLAVDPKWDGDRSDRNYTKYGDLPAGTYVRILRKRDGLRIAKTQDGEELRFGDLIEFEVEKNSSHDKNGHLLWRGIAKNIKKKSPGTSKTHEEGKLYGVVYIGETFAKRKHGESIFVVPEEKKEEVRGFTQEQIQKAYKGLEETLKIYRDPAINRSKGHSGYADFEHAKRENGIPVWYDVREQKLSLVSIGRTFFRKSLNELVGDRIPCTNRNNLCEACALFGMAKDESLGSRIRFSDARAEEGRRIEKETKTLKILGQPRYSYMPFYARSTLRGAFPQSYDDDHVEIAGRKSYWHDRRAEEDSGSYVSNERNNMNSTMELVMPGTEFRFDVYYDGITQEQLEKLMWCLHFGENKEEGILCHKFGHGKPLGLGSAKITIVERAERVFKDGDHKWEKEAMPGDGIDPKLKNKKALLKVMDYRGPNARTGKDIPIMYPDVYDENGRPFDESTRSNDEARHKWYSENKEKIKGKEKDGQILPRIEDEDQSLHIYEKVRQGGNDRNDHGSRNRRGQGRR